MSAVFLSEDRGVVIGLICLRVRKWWIRGRRGSDVRDHLCGGRFKDWAIELLEFMDIHTPLRRVDSVIKHLLLNHTFVIKV